MSRAGLVVAGVLGILPCSCASASSSTAGLFAPCERDSDCKAGLLCSGGVCSTTGGKLSDGGNDAKDADVFDAAASD